MRIFTTILTSTLLLATSLSAQATNFNTEQKNEIQQVVHDYLVNNPEVLVEVSDALQTKQLRANIEKNAEALFTNAASPVIGNPKARINVVEFFDYQCPYCKKMVEETANLLKAEPNIRYTFKELPIFGAPSQLAARAALAAMAQKKYMPLHDALLKSPEKPTQAIIDRLAKDAGLDVAQLKKDMNAASVQNELRTNMRLSQQLNIRGTPFFIIGAYPAGKQPVYRVIPGATTVAHLQQLISDVRKTVE